MYKINDYIVYKKDVCQIKDIKDYNNKKYYILFPIDDESLKINVPVDKTQALIRDIITEKDLITLINDIPNINVLDSINEKVIEQEYKELLNFGTHKDLIKIIKTTYKRNEQRFNNGKKISEKDDIYFKKAEKYLYNEFSIVLNKTFDETKEYVINMVKKHIK